MTKDLIKNTSDAFIFEFGTAAEHIFLSPGRINIIGEHVDYNSGFVLPAAIDKYICFAISASNNDRFTLIAKDLNDRYSFDLAAAVRPIEKMWANYLLGVVSQFISNDSKIGGLNVVFSSNIPIGSGLSSSAALECGLAYAINQIFGLGLSKAEIALIGQKSEHTFVGVNCGIMDQFASVFGKEGKVIKLDCDTLEYEYHNADFSNYSLLLLDSNVKHTHLTSGYNDRRRDTEVGLAIIKASFPEVRTFRDCNIEQLSRIHDDLGEVVYRRCRFVIEEIQRVRDAVDALKSTDIRKLGQLMSETHNGLSLDYEVSCDELDFLVSTAMQHSVVLGARMMGGGFGGCSINLVQKGTEEGIIAAVAEAYYKRFGIALKAYQVATSDGTSEFLE